MVEVGAQYNFSYLTCIITRQHKKKKKKILNVTAAATSATIYLRMLGVNNHKVSTTIYSILSGEITKENTAWCVYLTHLTPQSHVQSYQVSSVYLKRCWSYDHKVLITKYRKEITQKLRQPDLIFFFLGGGRGGGGGCATGLLNLVYNPTDYHPYISKGVGVTAITMFQLRNIVGEDN